MRGVRGLRTRIFTNRHELELFVGRGKDTNCWEILEDRCSKLSNVGDLGDRVFSSVFSKILGYFFSSFP